MFWSKKKNNEFGHIFIEEAVPYFSDRARTSNKKIFSIIRLTEDGRALCKELHGYTDSCSEHLYQPERIITQNDVPIHAQKSFWKAKYDPDFSLNGYIKEQWYGFKSLGYLGGIDTRCLVYIVTDQYVIFEDENKNSFSVYSYEELIRLTPHLLDIGLWKISG